MGSRAMLPLLALAAPVAAFGLEQLFREQAEESCPGVFNVQGLGDVHLVPTGWGAEESLPQPRVTSRGVEATLGSRAYFASACTDGVYSQADYLALDLRGKTIRYTTDISGAGCGCNGAVYLASIAQSKNASECHDYYCDANDVCGQTCTEIDIQESNIRAWHSTVHAALDPFGYGKGYGGGEDFWSGMRDWDPADYGPGARCIDTLLPFEVAFSFHTSDASGRLSSMELRLTQLGSHCAMSLTLDDYKQMAELDEALAAGMTPIVSYWNSSEMLWMDGAGMDKKGPCEVDEPKQCSEAVRFYDFSITPAFSDDFLPLLTAEATPGVPGPTPAPASGEHRQAHGGILGIGILVGAFATTTLPLGLVVVWIRDRQRGRIGERDLRPEDPAKRPRAGSYNSLLSIECQEELVA